MAERAIVLALVVALLVVAVAAVRWWARIRTTELQNTEGTVLLQALGVQPDGRPLLVTFATTSCAACHTAQAPAVEHLVRQLGSDSVRVVTVDAAEQPKLAKAFGVMTVPSSVIMRANGEVSAVNHGFATAQRLAEQLKAR